MADIDYKDGLARNWHQRVTTEFEAANRTLREVEQLCQEVTNGDTFLEQMVVVGKNAGTAWGNMYIKYKDVLGKLTEIFNMHKRTQDQNLERAKQSGRKSNL